MNSLTAALAFSMLIDGEDVCMGMIDEQDATYKVC